MSSTREELHRIMALTRDMLARAEAGAWDELIRLEGRRAAMLAHYFSVTRETGVDAGDAACVHELLELNDRILHLGKRQRELLSETLSESHRQRDAAARYRQTRAG